MYSDTIPLPSKGLFYDNVGEYVEAYFLTTEDELMMTAPNLFNKGDILYKLIQNSVCKHNNINIDDMLVNDKDFILLWLRENAYGNIIDNEDVEGRFYFDTNTINIKTIDQLPNMEDGCYLYAYKPDIFFKLKLLTVRDEKLLGKNYSKIDYYIAHIVSINDNKDKNYITSFIKHQPILDGRKFKKFVDEINFGVIKDTTYFINDKPVKASIDMNEVFFGYTQNNLSKINKALNEGIFFLMNEGQGYTNTDILKMPTWYRKFNEEKLVKKITKMNEQLKGK